MKPSPDQLDQPPQAALTETVRWSPAQARSSTSVPREESLSASTRLRQSRLRAAAFFFCVASVAYVVFTLIASDPLWPMHAGLAIALGIVCALLSRRPFIAHFWLRVAEFTIFGLAAVQLAVMHSYWILHYAQEQDAMGMLRVHKNGLVIATILMFAYAILIPSHWRTAAGAVLTLALIPVVTESFVFLLHPQATQFSLPEGTAAERSFDLFMMLIAVGLAVYGAHVLITLRREVFEARRLNQYQLGALLGAGAMGEVYRAEHRLLKRPCAVKLIHPMKEKDQQALARFEKEVRASARLSHPNIVEVYDYGHTDNGTFYYVMEYLDGLSLADMVDRYGPLPTERIVYLLRQVCDGLSEAHAAGLVHRDLKPANIFVSKIGQRHDVAKVLDFGLVWQRERHATLLKDSVDIAGTPAYMAPEQVEGDPAIDRRADIYALGCVCYYLLTGQAPFTSSTPLAVMMAHVRDSVVPPSQIAPHIDADLEQIVLRCLSKSPSDRFQSAEELSRAMSACRHADEWNEARAREWWQRLSMVETAPI